MLRKLQSAVLQQLCPVNHRMHQYILKLVEPNPAVFPAYDPFLRQSTMITHDTLLPAFHLIIDIVGEQDI